MIHLNQKSSLILQNVLFAMLSLLHILALYRILEKHLGKLLHIEQLMEVNFRNIFYNSGLYDHIMHQPNTRSNKNAIPFTSIDLKDDSGIIEYIDNILELAPIQLTEQGHEVLFKNIYEIFNNSVDHSRANHGVYACGHWMPQKKYLSFSVYDTGIGIPALIKKKN